MKLKKKKNCETRVHGARVPQIFIFFILILILIFFFLSLIAYTRFSTNRVLH